MHQMLTFFVLFDARKCHVFPVADAWLNRIQHRQVTSAPTDR